MQNARDYFLRTETTVRMLLKENQACKAKVRLIQESSILSNAAPHLTTAEITFGEWQEKNKNDKNVVLEAHQRYSIEAFAGSLLAGSVLEIAARAIEFYSENNTVPDPWEQVFGRNSPPPAFFVGRTLHTVPLGLIIYSGWNQYINHPSRGVREINQEVFARLATHSGQSEFQAIIDRNSDFNRLHAEYLASSVLDALCWNDYDHYISDMQYTLL